MIPRSGLARGGNVGACDSMRLLVDAKRELQN